MKVLSSKLFPYLNGVWTTRLNHLNIDAQSMFKDMDKNPLLDPYFCAAWIDHLHRSHGANYSYSGYMEDRQFLWRGSYMHPGHMTHLGLDYNVPEGIVVFLPASGKLVHLERDTDQDGGWGGKLIFNVSGRKLYFILGHLKLDCYLNLDRNIYFPDGLQVGKKYEQGTVVGLIGKPSENGGWYPHLHIQCMTEKMYKKHGPGVDGYAAYYEGIEDDFPHPSSIIKNDK